VTVFEGEFAGDWKRVKEEVKGISRTNETMVSSGMDSAVETASSGGARFYRNGPFPAMCCVGGEFYAFIDASITAECEEMLAHTAQSWKRFELTQEAHKSLANMLRRRLFAAFCKKAHTITCWCSCGGTSAPEGSEANGTTMLDRC